VAGLDVDQITSWSTNKHVDIFDTPFIYQMIHCRIWKPSVFAYPKTERHYVSSIEWALVGPSFTRENKLLVFLVYRGRACCSRLQNVWHRSALYFSVIALLKIKTNLAQQYCSDVFDPNPANTVSIEESFDEKRKIFDDGQLKNGSATMFPHHNFFNFSIFQILLFWFFVSDGPKKCLSQNGKMTTCSSNEHYASGAVYFLLKTFKIIVEKALFVLRKGLQFAVFYCFVTKKTRHDT
jgi:hypothetical protein